LLAASAAALSAAALASGCGGGERQDADEPSGTFKVAVVKASFAKHQRLSDDAVMRIVVRNAGAQTIPNIAVTVTNDDDAKGSAGFATRSADTTLSDPSRPLWIVDKGPHGGDTAYVSTWALGPLPAGRTRVFEWHVTPMVAGTHSLRWHVAAGLNGKAIARTRDGSDAAGTFHVTVSRKPQVAVVDPETGDVVSAPSASASAASN